MPQGCLLSVYVTYLNPLGQRRPFVLYKTQALRLASLLTLKLTKSRTSMIERALSRGIRALFRHESRDNYLTTPGRSMFTTRGRLSSVGSTARTKAERNFLTQRMSGFPQLALHRRMHGCDWTLGQGLARHGTLRARHCQCHYRFLYMKPILCYVVHN